jgi:hypothetical protein
MWFTLHVFLKFLINASKLICYFFIFLIYLEIKDHSSIFMVNNLWIKNRLRATLCVLNKTWSFFQYACGSSKLKRYGSISLLIVVAMIARAMYLFFVNVVVVTTWLVAWIVHPTWVGDCPSSNSISITSTLRSCQLLACQDPKDLFSSRFLLPTVKSHTLL